MVLHHHDNDVIDLAEPLGRGRRYPIRAGACGEGREHREEEAVVPVVPIDAHGGFQCARASAPWKVGEYTAPNSGGRTHSVGSKPADFRDVIMCFRVAKTLPSSGRRRQSEFCIERHPRSPDPSTYVVRTSRQVLVLKSIPDFQESLPLG
jgi:hypothetical protein